MDRDEARELLKDELAKWRTRPYASLAAMIGESVHSELTGPSGESYQVEIEDMWEYKPQGRILVLGAIDDGKWLAFAPLTDSFIVSPAGEFVGE